MYVDPEGLVCLPFAVSSDPSILVQTLVTAMEVLQFSKLPQGQKLTRFVSMEVQAFGATLFR
eukprot:SAG31_NODE_28241_length_413_cov_0.910828_1_plen_62_part_00